MTAATLSAVLGRAAAEGRAVAGLVVLGWEDARAYVEAAEEAGIAVILQAGPGCRRHTPTPILGRMFRTLADAATVPVVCHIDHATTIEECRAGVDAGFTSVMIDGSKLALDDNIAMTSRVVEEAHRAGVSVEGEVGVVGYVNGAPSQTTAPEDAARLERESGSTPSLSPSATSTSPRKKRRPSMPPRSRHRRRHDRSPGAAWRQRHSGGVAAAVGAGPSRREIQRRDGIADGLRRCAARSSGRSPPEFRPHRDPLRRRAVAQARGEEACRFALAAVADARRRVPRSMTEQGNIVASGRRCAPSINSSMSSTERRMISSMGWRIVVRL